LIQQAEFLSDAPEIGPTLPQKAGHQILSCWLLFDHLSARRDAAHCKDSTVLARSEAGTADAVIGGAKVKLNQESKSELDWHCGRNLSENRINRWMTYLWWTHGGQRRFSRTDA